MNWTTRYIAYAGLLLFILTAYFNIGHLHSDEHFQLIEFAQYKLGNTASYDLAWEFHEKMRPSLQVWLLLFIMKVLSFLQVENPFTIALILRLLSAFAYWLVITHMNKLLVERYFSESKFKNYFYLVSYFVWFVPFASVHFSSENFAAIFLLLGMFYLIKDHEKQGNLLLTGLFFSSFSACALSNGYRRYQHLSVDADHRQNPLKKVAVFLLHLCGRYRYWKFS
jgi:phosphatidylinositol glycan class B